MSRLFLKGSNLMAFSISDYRSIHNLFGRYIYYIMLSVSQKALSHPFGVITSD